MLGQRCRGIEAGSSVERFFQVPTGTKVRQEAPCGLIERNDLDAGRTALHQQMHWPGIDIEALQHPIIAVEHGAPDAVDRIVGQEEPNRRMRDKTDASLIVGRAGSREARCRTGQGKPRVVDRRQ